MGAAIPVTSSTAAPPGVGRSPESAPLSPQTVPSTERLNSPRPDRLGARLARWAKRATSPLARLRSLASGKKDKALDPKPVQTTSERLPGHHATNSAPQGDTAIGMSDVQTPGAAVRDSAGPATPGEPLPSGGQSGGSEAQANMREAATEEQQLDQALLVDWSVDQIFTGEDASSQQQKAEILNPLAKKPVAEIPDESLINAVHHGRRIPELAKALKDRADADPNGFGIKLQVAQQEEQKQRVEAWRKVGVQMGPNGDVVDYPDKPYAAIRAKLDAVTGDTPEATAARQKIWQEALQNGTNEERVMVKTLARYHAKDEKISQDAFDVVGEALDEQTAASITEDTIDNELKDVLSDADIDSFPQEFKGSFGLSSGEKRDADEAIRLWSKAKDIRELARISGPLGKVRNRYIRARAWQIATQKDINIGEEMQKARDTIEVANQQISHSQDSEVQNKWQVELQRQKIELLSLGRAQKFAREIADGGRKIPDDFKGDKLDGLVKERRDQMDVLQSQFDSVRRKIEGKNPNPNNRFLRNLRDLPDLLQEYPDAGNALEKVAKNKSRKKKLLLLLIILTLASGPMVGELQKLMGIRQ